MNTIIDKLKRTSILSHIPKDNLKVLINASTYKISKFNKGDTIISSASNSNYIGFILKGFLNIEKNCPSGKPISLFHKKASDFFCYFPLSDSEIYPYTIKALENSEILFIDRTSFLAIINSNMNCFQEFLTLISNKLLHIDSKLETLSHTTAKERLVHSLLFDFNVSKENPVVKLPFSKNIWASSINISKSTLYRELNFLIEDDLIIFKSNKTILIKDLNKLKKALCL